MARVRVQSVSTGRDRVDSLRAILNGWLGKHLKLTHSVEMFVLEEIQKTGIQPVLQMRECLLRTEAVPISCKWKILLVL